jgi:tripartite-type tricarboxylate transporter receptor subunit TctC
MMAVARVEHRVLGFAGMLSAALLAAAVPGSGALAQDYPTREIHVVVGYVAGTGPDLYARFAAEQIRKGSNQTVIVENKVGAMSNIAAGQVARAKPDGYTTFVTGGSTFTTNPYLFKEVPFKLADFTPVTSLQRGGLVFITKPESGIKTLKDLVALLKQKDGKAKFAYVNPLAFGAAELFKQRTGTQAVPIAYKGAPDALMGLAGGEADFMVSDPTPIMGARDKYNVLAATTADRLGAVPDVPGMKESGFDDFDLSAWWAVWMPAGAPADAVNKVATWVEAGLKTEEAKKFFYNGGFEPWIGVRGDALRQFAEKEAVKWGTIMKLTKIEPQ